MNENDTQDNVGIKIHEQTKKPAMYAAVVHNDAFTPRDFVVTVLQKYFQKNGEEAARIMLKAHTTGASVVAVYTYEVAETKTAAANSYSQEQGKMLLFSVEEV